MIHYHIINLPESKRRKQLVFWGIGSEANTTHPARALIVNEDHLNAALERYDNGATTRAILTDKVQAIQGDWQQLTDMTPYVKGEAA
ncbi:hypothetical protein QKW35_14575 [Pontibacterium granulatum]|uniref:hypothetical protein n=1 Tax=Pontibacterium granulatum TaxID=2036029 RepID=UPI00249B69E5|nr:hypothetical protein [Pontibacterium granulatum]MDI3325600.1 hypothetical protein [Pontibacterium granulatum]